MSGVGGGAGSWIGSGGGGGGTPGGSFGSIQFNNAGSFSGFGYTDGTNLQLPGVIQDLSYSNTSLDANNHELWTNGATAVAINFSGSPTGAFLSFDEVTGKGIFNNSISVGGSFTSDNGALYTDGSGNLTAGAYTGQEIAINPPSYPTGFFQAQSGYGWLGDYGGSVNTNYILVQDGSQYITVNTPTFFVTDSTYPAQGLLGAVASGGFAYLGDSSGSQNGTCVTVNDGGEAITVNAQGSVLINGPTSITNIVELADSSGSFGSSGQFYGSNGSGGTGWGAPNFIPNVLSFNGDMLYYNGSSYADLAGNGLATKKFLTQTSYVPSWQTIVQADLPTTSVSVQNKRSSGAQTSSQTPLMGATVTSWQDWQVMVYVHITAITAGTLYLQVNYYDENLVQWTLDLFPIGTVSRNMTATGIYLFPAFYLSVYTGNSSININSTFAGTSISYYGFMVLLKV